MKVKVEMRPGSHKGQRLTTEDGELIEGVASITWKATGLGEEAPKVTVEFFASRVNFDLTEPESSA